jgi:hypothetical protein
MRFAACVPVRTYMVYMSWIEEPGHIQFTYALAKYKELLHSAVVLAAKAGTTCIIS